MKVNIDKYFLSANAVSDIPESQYAKLEPVVEAIKAFVRDTGKYVYVVDYLKKNFLYVSENMEKLCGISAEEMLRLGYGYFDKYVPQKEQQMLLELNKRGFEYFDQLPMDDREDYSISYDFPLVNNGLRVMVHHELTHLIMTRKGRLWLALCTMTLSSAKEPGNIILKRDNSPNYLEYDLTTHSWISGKRPTLNEVERLLLRASMQGFTMEEIANQNHISINTLKSSKRLLFKKLNVSSITQAVAYAQNNQMM